MAKYPLRLVKGRPLRCAFSLKVDGVLIHVEDVAAKIRAEPDASSTEILDLAPYITQDVDGVLLLIIPGDVTGSLALTPRAFWALTGTAGGIPYELVEASQAVVVGDPSGGT